MPASPRTPTLRVGCQANAWQRELKVQDHLPEVLRQIAAAGYDGVELPAWSLDLANPQPVRDLLASHSLAPIAIHVGGNFYDPAAYRDTALPLARRGATAAAALGAEGVVVSAAAKNAALTTVPFDPDRSAPHSSPERVHARKTPAELRTQADHLAEVARLNRDHGLATYYHNHSTEFAHDAEELRAILEVDPSLLSLCFDIGNAARGLPGDALAATMERYWPRITYLHFKDPKGDTLAEALGEGDVDFAPIGALAARLGFQGWATAEIEPAPNMVTRRTVAEDSRLSCTFIRQTLSAAATP